MDVSIIIVNYNTKELTRNCLKSVFEQTKEIEFEVIVSDNGSTDGSIEMIKIEFPQVILIENKVNLGFGTANNIGAKIAKGKYLFFLNSDTVLENNAVAKFYSYYEEECKDDCALGAYLHNKDGSIGNSYGRYSSFLYQYIHCVYNLFPSLLNKRKKSLNKQRNDKEKLYEKSVPFVTGADLFMKTSIFKSLNGFDEKIFMYFEDEDLCRRASELGCQCKIILKPQITHLESQSFKMKFKKFSMELTSFIYYMRKTNVTVAFYIKRALFFVAMQIMWFSKTLSFKQKFQINKILLGGKS